MRVPGRLTLGLTLVLGALGAQGRGETRSEAARRLAHSRQDLKQLDQKRRLAQQKLNVLAKAKRGISGRIDQDDRELETYQRDSRVQVRNLMLAQDRLNATSQSLAQSGSEEQVDRAALAVQLRAVQRARGREGAALLFGARTPAQWAARSSALRELSLGTQRRVLALREVSTKLEAFRALYAKQADEYQRAHGLAEASRLKVLRESAKNKATLESIKRTELKDQRAKAELEAEIEQKAKSVQDLMEALQQEDLRREAQRESHASTHGTRTKVAQTSSGPSTIHGRVPWPVVGRLLSRFGKQRHPVFNVNVFNRGIEIAAAYGTPVRAIAAGTVEHVAEMQGFGHLIVLDHGGGLKSVYGYASEALVQMDQKVAQGEAIGEVGQHGAEGQPSLYFQISKNAHPQDPLSYLTRR